MYIVSACETIELCGFRTKTSNLLRDHIFLFSWFVCFAHSFFFPLQSLFIFSLYLVSNIERVAGWVIWDAGRSIQSLTGFDVDTYLRSIVPMRLTHCVRPPLVNLYTERMAQCPAKYNTLFVGAPLGRPLGMQQTRQKNLLPSSVRMQSMFFV